MKSNLSHVQVQFLDMVCCFIRDREYTCPEELIEASCPPERIQVSENTADTVSMQKLYELSVVHKLSPAVFEVLRTSMNAAQLSRIPLWNVWKNAVIRESVFQTRKVTGFLGIYNKLLQAGVRPLVVKGIVCRSLYSKPDYRASSDEDLLVRAEEASICDKILLENGFLRDEFDLEKLPHEVSYRNPSNGVYLEIHFTLFDETSGVFSHLNSVFCDVFENAVCLKLQESDIWTLEPTKHFLYLICHCYKHFLHSGFGIRQVCDIILMAEKWHKDMDWKYLGSILDKLHMSRFLRGLLDIGTCWLGMEEEIYSEIIVKYVAAYEPKSERSIRKMQAEDLLADILDAGIYGKSSGEREHSANITLAAAEKKSGIMKSLFPGKGYMEKQYPFVKKYPFLLPLAWLKRIVKYLSEKQEQDNSLEMGRLRVELLKKYDVIE